MVLFIFMSLLMVSLSAMLYLFVRALPRVGEEPAAAYVGGIAHAWRRSEIPEKIDAFVNDFLLKSLRKLKVVILKLDNNLSRHLQRIKPKTDMRQSSIDFKEIAEQNKEGERTSL